MSFGKAKDLTFPIFIHLAQNVTLSNEKEQLGKFDAKSDEGVFLGYSLTSKAYRVFNKRTLVVEESIHVSFDDNMPLDRINNMCTNLDKVKLDEKNDNNELKEDRSNIDAYNQPSNLDLPKE